MTVTPSEDDATVARAALTGVTVAAWTALPEYVPSRLPRLAAQAGLLTVAGLASLFLAPAEPEPDPERDEAMAAVSRAMENPAKRVVIISGVTAVLAAASRVEHRAIEAGSAWFAARGMDRPRTALGLTLGVLAAASEFIPAAKHAQRRPTLTSIPGGAEQPTTRSA